MWMKVAGWEPDRMASLAGHKTRDGLKTRQPDRKPVRQGDRHRISVGAVWGVGLLRVQFSHPAATPPN
jgi:hypothetical protein